MNKLRVLAAILFLLGGVSIVRTTQTASATTLIAHMAVSMGIGGLIVLAGVFADFNRKAVLIGLAAGVISGFLIFSCERVMPISVAVLLSGTVDLVLSFYLLRGLFGSEPEKPKRKSKNSD